MKNILSLLLIVCIAFGLNAQAAKIDFQNKSWEALKAEAQSSNKLIFVDAYTTWCGPCKKMDAKVFTDGSVAEFFNKNFINAKVDMEKGEGPELARTYGVAAYPTLLFVNAEGEAVHRGLGFHDVGQILELATVAMDGSSNLLSLMDRFNQGDREPEFLMDLVEKSYELQNGSHLPIAEAILNGNPPWKPEDKLDFVYSLTTDTDTELFDYILKNRKSFEARFGIKEVESKISDLIYLESNLDMDPTQMAKLDALFKKAYPKTAKKESANFRMAYFRQKGDRANFGLAAKKYMKQNKAAPAAELNDIAWTFYQVIEDPKLLKLATKWSKKSIKLAPKGYSYETLASLYEKSGDMDAAKDAVQQGIAVSKAANEDTSALEELQQRLASIN